MFYLIILLLLPFAFKIKAGDFRQRVSIFSGFNAHKSEVERQRKIEFGNAPHLVSKKSAECVRCDGAEVCERCSIMPDMTAILELNRGVVMILNRRILIHKTRSACSP